MEMLERRQLLAAVPLGAFSGSVLIDGARHHAVLDVSAESNNGLVSGSFRADGVGRFAFTGSSSNGVVTIVFSGAAGAGSIVAALDSTAGTLRGQISDEIGGVRHSGSARLTAHDTTSASATPPAATLLAEPANPSAQTGITGSLSGTVRFTGDGANALGSRQRVHATVHVDSIGSDSEIAGGFRLDRIGRFRYSGFLGSNGQASVVFANGTGSGSLIFNVNVSSSGVVVTPSISVSAIAGSSDSKGKIFAHLAGSDVHGVARLTKGAILLNGLPVITPPTSLPSTTPISSGNGAAGSTTNAGSTVDQTGSGMTTTTTTTTTTSGSDTTTPSVGSVIDTIGAPSNTIGGIINTVGAPGNTVGSSTDTVGSTINTVGSPLDTIGTPFNTVGSPINVIGTPM
jgi:hypothetical protein